MIRNRATAKSKQTVPLAFLYVEAIGEKPAYRFAKPVVRFVKESHPEATVFDFDSSSEPSVFRQAEELANQSQRLVVAVSIKDASGAWKIIGFLNKLLMLPNTRLSAVLQGEEESIERILGSLGSDFIRVDEESQVIHAVGKQLPH